MREMREMRRDEGSAWKGVGGHWKGGVRGWVEGRGRVEGSVRLALGDALASDLDIVGLQRRESRKHAARQRERRGRSVQRCHHEWTEQSTQRAA